MAESWEPAVVREIVMDTTRTLIGVAARSLGGARGDVTLAQFRVLLLVDGRGPSTMGELADALDVGPSTLARLCTVLVERRYLRRERAADNRRAKIGRAHV